MLVFSTRLDDKIVIGEPGDVLGVITVLARNRLGFEFQRHIPVDRWDVRQDVLANGRIRKLG